MKTNTSNNKNEMKHISYAFELQSAYNKGYAKALDDVACLLRDLCFKKEGSKKLKLWCYDGIEAGKYDEIQEQIAKLSHSQISDALSEKEGKRLSTGSQVRKLPHADAKLEKNK